MSLEAVGGFGVSLSGVTLLGAVAGYASKKVAKLIGILIGLELSLFAFFEHQGVLSVDWNALSAWMMPSAEVQVTLMETLASAGLFTGGFGVGFLLGFKKA